MKSFKDRMKLRKIKKNKKKIKKIIKDRPEIVSDISLLLLNLIFDSNSMNKVLKRLVKEIENKLMTPLEEQLVESSMRQ